MTTTTEGVPTHRLTATQVWRAVRKASFADLAYVTPSGEPRTSGVVYKVKDHRLYVAVAPDSWKAKHVAANRRVAVTVPVRRGGVLALVLPIPPATISFHGTATVHPPGAPEIGAVLDALGSLLPPERRGSAAVIEIEPVGAFVTYGIGIPLRQMQDPERARARVAV